MASYDILGKEIVAEIKRLVFDEKNWKLEKDKFGVKVYSVATSNSTKSKCYKGESLVEMSPERIIDIVHPFSKYRNEFDPNLVSCEVVEEIAHNSAVAYQIVNPKIMKIRLKGDSIDLFVFDKEDDYYFSVFSGVKYNESFTKSDGIRGWAHPSGLLAFKTDDPNVSKVITIYHAEFDLPKFLVMTMVEKASIKGIIKYFVALKKMKGAKYERLGPDVPLCRNRING